MEATQSQAAWLELHHPHDLVPELYDKAHDRHNDDDRDNGEDEVKEWRH